MMHRRSTPDPRRIAPPAVTSACLTVLLVVSCTDSPADPDPSPTPPISAPVRPELVPLWALYESTDGDRWRRRDNWLTDAPIHTWAGVTVDAGGRVSALSLARNNLSGAIPRELGDLVGLERLSLDNNNLAGSIPRELGNLASLGDLWLNDNNLTGAVPSELGRLTQLEILRLSNNARLGGPLPASLTGLDRLARIGTAGTALCAPLDPVFQAWIRGVSGTVGRCLEDTGPTTVYLTQVVQSRSIPVPLVADRPAFLRVFVTAAKSTAEPIPAVRATFYVNDEKTYTAEIPVGTKAIPTAVDERSWAGSANARIPGEVIRPGLELVVEIDPEGTLDAALGVERRIPEQGRLAVDVREVAALELTLIPFLWRTAPDEAIVAIVDGMAANPEAQGLLQDARHLLPVAHLNVIAHEPVLSSSNEARKLLSQTATIRAMEGRRGHYMGMMSGSVSGPVGLASIGGRTSFSKPVETTIAHELGHNMSLQHAPCGNPSGVDPAYPHTDGTIGSWGWDAIAFGDWQVIRPSSRDLMSYCGPRWISGYHFTKALDFRIRTERARAAPARVANVGAAATATTRSLLLWGGIDTRGEPFLEPAFVVDAPPTLPEPGGGAFEVSGRSAAGDWLFSLSFDMPEIADADGASSFAFLVPVGTDWAGDVAAITLSGPGGTVTLDGDTDRPMVILRNPRNGQVRGFLRDPPPAALAGSAVDIAALAPERGLEALFSRGLPRPGG